MSMSVINYSPFYLDAQRTGGGGGGIVLWRMVWFSTDGSLWLGGIGELLVFPLWMAMQVPDNLIRDSDRRRLRFWGLSMLSLITVLALVI
ncbi:hypothetical protein M0R45_034200 [Rubus argutus]|uniref:Uncharacterized protein n=1 Tax=Rubus argutus TaxID=59490 RepID=A0AAW1VQF0_RUBAR